MKNFFLKILGLLIGFTILFWLITTIGTREFLENMSTAKISDVICALTLVLFGIYLRALRWKSLFLNEEQMGVYPFFSAIMIGALANNILPARGGDLVRVYILGNNTSFSKSNILATVLIERLSDLLLVCFMSLLVVSAFPMQQWIQNVAMFVGGGSLVGLVVLMVLSNNPNSFFGLFLKLFNVFPKWIRIFLQPIIRDFMQGIKVVISKRSVVFIILTILIWGFEITTLWFFAKSFGFVLSFCESLFVMIHAVLSCFVPFVPAQIGVWELSIQSSMTFLGYEGSAILAFALAWHFTLVFVGSFIGAVCLFLNGNSLFMTYTTAQEELKS